MLNFFQSCEGRFYTGIFYILPTVAKVVAFKYVRSIYMIEEEKERD